ncbi:MAG: YfiR family protein [Methyloglobulus sp.]|nr:YfiR family protein [Methyloglobulus sp.]
MKTSFSTRMLLCLGLLFSTVIVADDDNIEYKVKAGYLYNFTKFVSWPEVNSATFNLCILGNDPFGDTINAIEKKTALSRSIRIVRFKTAKALSGVDLKPACHILYVSGITSQSDVEKITTKLKKANTLVVGENESFAQNGGMIGLVNRNGKIKLQINLQSVNGTHLKISAKLLEIAELIKVAGHD